MLNTVLQEVNSKEIRQMCEPTGADLDPLEVFVGFEAEFSLWPDLSYLGGFQSDLFDAQRKASPLIPAREQVTSLW